MVRLDAHRLHEARQAHRQWPIESFNGRLRDEFLNVNEFVTLHDARDKLSAWQDDYNHHRPHGSLGHLTPSEFVNTRSVQPEEAVGL
jgi:putative transposase